MLVANKRRVTVSEKKGKAPAKPRVEKEDRMTNECPRLAKAPVVQGVPSKGRLGRPRCRNAETASDY
jgi:hypothetical protein